MTIGSIVAIYFLFFVATAFATLSVGVRTDEEAGTPKVLISLVVFALYYANWTYGWITPDDLDFYN
jgi:uncharacterized membrane protein YhaH (DUF805 family)